MTTSEIIISSVGLLFGGGWLWEAWKRKHPSELERSAINTSNATFSKVYAEAQMVNIELREELQKMVDEKTEHIEELLVKREIEHAQATERLIKKLAEETARAEDYWEQLKDAKKEVAYWKSQYEEIKNRHQ